MDDLGVAGEVLHAARHPVVEAQPDADQHVGLTDRAVGRHAAVHAGHAQPQWVGGRKPAQAHQGGDGGNLPGAGERGHFSGGPLRPAADHENWALGTFQELNGGGNGFGARLHPAGLGLRLYQHAPEGRHLHVFGDIDQHRPRTTCGGDPDGLGHDARQVVGVLHHVVVLGDGQGDAGNIGLLKGVGADQVAGHVAGDGEQRHAVHHGVGQPGHQIGGPRPGSRHAHAQPPGGFCVPFGGVDGPLLVAAQHMPDLGVIGQGVVHRHDRAAGVAEHRVDAVRG